MEIRVATGDDLAAVRALYEDSLEAGEQRVLPILGWEDVRPGVEHRLEQGGILLAEDDGVVVGFVDGELRTAQLLRIERLHAREPARREEITQELLTALVRQAAEDGATHVVLEVQHTDEHADSMLARWGFVPLWRGMGVELEILRRDLERGARGESFGSVHVQTDDLPAVERAVLQFVPLLAGRSEGSVIVPPRAGWTSVYDELCDRDPAGLRRLARELSDRLGAVVLALGVEEGAVTRFLLLDRGRLLDEYLSVPEYYGPLPSGEVVGLAANPTLVERLTGADRQAVRAAAVVGKRPEELPPAPEIAAGLARAMRIEGGEHGYARAVEIPGAIRTEGG